ncbi:MAG: hypothetical protein PF444_02350 [Bacteroidales bacterium]|jgi:hypothetical protein|nr:hypothetical protein [Bacteroidales bacterium]
MNILDLEDKLEQVYLEEVEKTPLDLNNYNKIESELITKFTKMAMTSVYSKLMEQLNNSNVEIAETNSIDLNTYIEDLTDRFPEAALRACINKWRV